MGNMDQNWTPTEEVVRVGDFSGDPFIAVGYERWGTHFTAADVNSPDFGTVLNEHVREAGRRHAAEVERRILAGENRIEMPYGGMVGRRAVYTVPIWHREPIKRLRIEWARWKARRG